MTRFRIATLREVLKSLPRSNWALNSAVESFPYKKEAKVQLLQGPRYIDNPTPERIARHVEREAQKVCVHFRSIQTIRLCSRKYPGKHFLPMNQRLKSSRLPNTIGRTGMGGIAATQQGSIKKDAPAMPSGSNQPALWLKAKPSQAGEWCHPRRIHELVEHDQKTAVQREFEEEA